MTHRSAEILLNCTAWNAAFAIQRETVLRFHEACAATLGEGCPLKPIDAGALSMHRNLFSTLFIMATAALGVKDEKLRLYAMVNQCLRTLVTGCDNLLDDEYKAVIPFDLPGEGIRFRSVLQIMTADAVLARLITEEVAAGKLDPAKATELPRAVLAVLIPSGVEEHEEEAGRQGNVPTPEEMRNRILFAKTGLLFQAPLRVVERLGEASHESVDDLAAALTQFGVACQILDDIKDVADDLTKQRHNYVVSMAFHAGDPHERDVVCEALRHPRLPRAMAEQVAGALSEAVRASLSSASTLFMNAYRVFARAVPSFGLREAMALGALIQASIMRERNALVAKVAL